MVASDAWTKWAFLALAVITLLHLLLEARGVSLTAQSVRTSYVRSGFEPHGALAAADIDALHAAHDDELLHLINLNAFCRKEDDVLIPWHARSTRDLLGRDSPHSAILAELRKCPDVDVYLNTGVRDHGYCEDAMVYTLHLQSRAIPKWVLEATFLDVNGTASTYFELCPRSAILFMNHYWEDVHKMPSFPSTKKLVLMPNVEMGELTPTHYHRVDIVLAKSRDAFNRIWAWYNQNNNNPRGTKVLYTQHTTSDATVLMRNATKHMGPKDFGQLRVVHANGKSPFKNAGRILNCWKAHPEFPVLHQYSSDDWSNGTYNDLWHGSPLPNVDFHFGQYVSSMAFAKILHDATVIVCPSAMEGFGHYINQARAAGALVVTTDAPPMDEFVDDDSGVLIHGITPWPDKATMGQNIVFEVPIRAICEAIEDVVAMDPRERARRAANGVRRYFKQLQYFKQSMQTLQVMVRST
ncbi:hypothetical protein SPRG_13678 [Saprolegnia parasitica CBS 223.65]|uniref:Glycosyl transferase family 1 domain-containing protein n=1 Tax=Saprolegnia parasitica (strain CBS 223.65) TaxID=695850 RepID=A0A067BWZ4_SAPPC|nr:hypothetical protein SPRG_13678 [Saprolegnia parasitica CBS 223.65]KDO21365.1 hypothetical protein SPRG_13678 [Saprolegnia parasitica CBS 223.65]|eukprot:XP_012207921.1 hypothetical protein SPRG_13678 [Saprolegnia parasitica CBS 223.65]